jgi:hypothetical protein
MGGLCVAANMAPSINRALQQSFYCDEGSDDDGLACDCSQFNNTSLVGNFTCTASFCEEQFCANYAVSASINADGSLAYINCYEFDTAINGLESYCYYLNFSLDRNSTEWEIKFNGVECTSCEYDEQVTCPAGSPSSGESTAFDCTNTIMKGEGDMCDGVPVD